MHTKPSAVVPLQNSESRALWPSILRYIQSNNEAGLPVIVEGVGVLPELLAQSELKDYHCVFIGNTSNEHVHQIRASAHRDPNDWMHYLSDEAIDAFGKFSQAFSEYVKLEAGRYDMPYIEVLDNDYDQAMKQALQSLRNGQ